jgi:hypothetical protein
MPKNTEVKAEVKTEPTMREVLPIPVRSVQLDQVTQTRRYWIVNLDPAIVPQDITDNPSLWRLVQAQRHDKCLGPNDHVEMRGNGFTIFAVVNEIDKDAVYFYNVKNVARPSRTAALFEDDKFAIAMSGSAYVVRRKGVYDPHPFGGKVFETAAQARAFILTQYATKVA